MNDTVGNLGAFVDQWYEQFLAGDAAAITDLYSAEARLYLADLPGVRGQNAIGKFLANLPQHLDLRCRHSVDDIDVVSENIAVITGSAWVESRPKGGEGEQSLDASRFVMVMVRDALGDAWRCRYDVSQHTPDVKAATAPPMPGILSPSQEQSS